MQFWPFLAIIWCFSLQLLLYPFPERWNLNRVIHWSHIQIYIRQTTEFSSWSLDFRLALPTKKGAGHSSTKVGWSLAPWSTTVCAAWPHIVSLSAILAPQCNWNQSSKQPLLFLKDAHHQFLSAEIGLFVFFWASLTKVGDWPSPQKHSLRTFDSCQPQFNRDKSAKYNPSILSHLCPQNNYVAMLYSIRVSCQCYYDDC